MLRRRFLEGSALFSVAGALPEVSATKQNAADKTIFNVLSYGASGGGSHLDTVSIQAAIDACSMAGGGTVLFPAGRYLTGTLFLRSNVSFWLGENATVLGSPNLADYPPHRPAFQATTAGYTDKYVIYGEKIENISIEGHGTIDGQGMRFERTTRYGRPYLMRFSECRNISVRGITLRDSAMWVQHYLACTQVLIDGIRVISHTNFNNDGIDIECCDRVRIANCDIDSGDDAIVLKSGGGRVTRDVTVANCVLHSNCNALKAGTESNGGFENIAFANCAIHDTHLSGLALESVDGGTLSGVVASNLTMNGVGCPLFIRLGDRARPIIPGGEGQPPGRVSDILIENVLAVGVGPVGCSITGIPQHPVQNVALNNFQLIFAGGGTREEAEGAVAENPKAYPEFKMFGVLPAYGVYCRHVRGLRLSNMETAFATAERRPALLCDDVDGLGVSNSHFAALADGTPSIVLRGTRNAMVQGCRADRQQTFLSMAGADTQSITIVANDLHHADKPVALGPDVETGAVFAVANHT